jgi:hypothetical protein
MRFGQIRRTNVQSVALTQNGRSFASLKNPVIDLSETERTLSDEEIEFLVDHLRVEVPSEWKFIEQTLGWIASGNNTPNKLRKKVTQEYSNWSEAVANTNRVGVLSRMQELGLISRSRDAKGATYHQTSMGEVLLK